METVNNDYVEYSPAECDKIRAEYYATKEKHDSDLSKLTETAKKIDKLIDEQSLLLGKSLWGHPINHAFLNFQVKMWVVDSRSVHFPYHTAIAKFHIDLWNRNIEINKDTLYLNLTKMFNEILKILKEELKEIQLLQKEADSLFSRLTDLEVY